jgi:hypothetical protein
MVAYCPSDQNGLDVIPHRAFEVILHPINGAADSGRFCFSVSVGSRSIRR